MASICFSNRRFELQRDETVLEGLLREGFQPVHACRVGTCQSCLMRATSGAPPAAAQQGLKDTWRARGYFLPCRCTPEEDLTIEAPDAASAVPARVESVTPLSHDVVKVRLEADEGFDHRAGQFVNLAREDGLTRSYSIASLPAADRRLDLHVRRTPGGRMSTWLHDEARPGDRMLLRGPAGECFYVPGKEDQVLLLVGTGTGLAPLVGIVHDALRHGHRGPIHLIHGARDESGLYLVDELLALVREHPQLRYLRCLLEGEASPGVEIGPLDALVLAHHPSMRGYRVFLCGHPALVTALRKKAFLAGASTREIHADAFVGSDGGAPGLAIMKGDVSLRVDPPAAAVERG